MTGGDATAIEPPPTDEWCRAHFDHTSPALAQHLYATMARMRAGCPVAHSDAHGGFWVASRYEDVLRVAQDWEAFSSALGISVPNPNPVVPAIPVHIDPPLQRIYKRIINTYLTPAMVAPFEEPTRALVTRLIDGFIEDGRCEFMSAFARPLPGLAFFELFLNTRSDDLERLGNMAYRASIGDRSGWVELHAWIVELVGRRRAERSQRGDVVDGVIGADIDGRPITDDEIVGILQLLVLGGLDTTAGALGQIMIRFCEQPEIPALLRERPELLVPAVEELLRLDGPFAAIGRTAAHATEIAGQPIAAGEKVLIYWASANRDEAVFADPDRFDPLRSGNRHLAFGAGPHRCAGSNLARLNLQVAVRALVDRLADLTLDTGGEPIRFHSVLNRAPLAVPIRFRPAPRSVKAQS